MQRARWLTAGLLVALAAGCSGDGSHGGAPTATPTTAPTATATATNRLSAKLTPSEVVTPANRPWRAPAAVSEIRGTFSGTLRGRELSWEITYAGLANEPLVIADIHVGKRGSFGPFAVRLCDDCKSGQHGTKRLTRQELELLQSDSWVTLITNLYPNGVVRGQISRP